MTLAVAVAALALALAGGGADPLELGIAVAGAWLLLGALVLGGRLDPRRADRELLVAVGALAVLVAWTVLSVRWGEDDGAAFAEAVRLTGYLGIVLLVGLLARPGSARSWVAGLALGGVAVALVALASRTIGFGADAELARELPPAADRLSHPLGYWNALGYLMAMTLPPLAYLAADARGPLARAAVAGSVPVVLALVLTSSRGALLAAAVGLLALALITEERRRLLLAAASALPVWLLVVALATVRRDQLDPIAGSLGWGLAVAAAVLAGALLAQFLFARLEAASEPAGGSGPSVRRGGLVAFAALAAALAVAVTAAVGPSTLIGEFRTARVDSDGAAEALVSGSGRLSFWGAAVDAFESDPARGVGAGGYGSYWLRSGDLEIPSRSAHSLQLQTLAELGLPGGLALGGFLAAALVAAWRRVRGAAPGQRGVVGALVGILLAGLVAVSFDWTWEVPAAVVPLLAAVALLSGAATVPAGRARGPGVVRGAGSDPAAGRWAGIPSLRAAVLVAAAAAIWAGSTLAIAAAELSRSADRLSDGDLSGAAEHARAAAAVEPWSVEPQVQLATVELAAGNLDAARRRAERAAVLAPADIRPWLLLTSASNRLGDERLAAAYLRRAVAVGFGRTRFRSSGL